MTSKPLTQEKVRQSRIRLTKELIQTKNLSGLLNNTKWFEIFECFENSKTTFDLKLLPEDKLRHCDFILELEDTSVLLDNSGDFIDFVEIELVKFKKDPKLTKDLDNLRIEYSADAEYLIIQGYR